MIIVGLHPEIYRDYREIYCYFHLFINMGKQ